MDKYLQLKSPFLLSAVRSNYTSRSVSGASLRRLKPLLRKVKLARHLNAKISQHRSWAQFGKWGWKEAFGFNLQGTCFYHAHICHLT